MNKIFSHRYNNGEIIVVSELIKKNGKKNNSHFVFFVVSLMFLTLPFEVIGSVVNDKIQYQMYRDFSENKGIFNTEEKKYIFN
ncbi:TPA: S6 family peptidase [Escherichia coli]